MGCNLIIKQNNNENSEIWAAIPIVLGHFIGLVKSVQLESMSLEDKEI